jgi:cytochrome c oxidase assembly protein subunit 15
VRLLIGLVALQWGLGIVTWIVNYGVVVHSERWEWAARYVILSKGYIESLIVTGHVATGQLLVAFSVVIWLRVLRTAESGGDFVSERTRRSTGIEGAGIEGAGIEDAGKQGKKRPVVA